MEHKQIGKMYQTKCVLKLRLKKLIMQLTQFKKLIAWQLFFHYYYKIIARIWPVSAIRGRLPAQCIQEVNYSMIK